MNAEIRQIADDGGGRVPTSMGPRSDERGNNRL